MEKKEHGMPSDLIIPAIVAFFNVLIILFPQDILYAAREGLSLWFNNAAPALLPFIIGTNILIGLGFVSFVGTLLEPVMRPIFRVPGCGGYALVTGMTSGYPLGAKTVALLRETNQLNKTEAQRLIAFCNNSGPLFILAAVGAGLFGNPRIGVFIIICHYAGAIMTGVLFRFFEHNKSNDTDYGKHNKTNAYNTRVFAKALKAMRVARRKDGRVFSEILSDSVRSAMETIVIIGGFIILFCVIVKMFAVLDIFALFSPLYTLFGIEPQLFNGLIAGVIEVTNGMSMLSQSPLSVWQMVFAAALVSFGGLSVFAQTVSVIYKTDISLFVYFCSKIIHSMLAAFIAIVLFPFFNFEHNPSAAMPVYMEAQNHVLNRIAYSGILFAISIAIIVVAICFVCMVKILFIKRRSV